MSQVVAQSQRLLAERGPSSIGFYTSGQLFLEEYYTLAAIGHGAIGTNHVDLCTATAAAALKDTFACDGQPGSYSDVDHADVIALFGHNVAETQSVLWMRMLDRLAGPNPPRLVCVAPRQTEVARTAGDSGGVHLAPAQHPRPAGGHRQGAPLQVIVGPGRVWSLRQVGVGPGRGKAAGRQCRSAGRAGSTCACG